MAYATISELKEITSSNLSKISGDWLIVTRESTSYKISAQNLRRIFNEIYSTENVDWFNKTLTSNSNLIHANTLHTKVRADAELYPGDLVQVNDDSAFLAVQSVIKANGTKPAIGIVKDHVQIGQTATIITGGVYENFDDEHLVNTSMFNKGDTLFLNPLNGELTSDKPTTGLEQSIGVVLSSDATRGAIVVNFSASIEKSSQVYYDSDNTVADASNVQDAIDEIWTILNTEIKKVRKEITDLHIIQLTDIIVGNTIYGTARIFDTIDSTVYEEYTCEVSGQNIVFEAIDNLPGKFAEITYLGIRN